MRTRGTLLIILDGLDSTQKNAARRSAVLFLLATLDQEVDILRINGQTCYPQNEVSRGLKAVVDNVFSCI